MNKAKKILIIIAIIFSYLNVGGEIYDVVSYFMLAPHLRQPVFYVILDFITIAECLAVAILLIIAIWKNGSLFRQRYRYYMTAIMISIIINLFSVTTILLIATMFISDWVWIKPVAEKETVIDIVPEKSKEEKIAQLKAMKEKGEITEEEFQKQLFDLL